jgi:hypothetical protein
MSEPRHETSDLDPKYVMYFAVALVAVGIMVFLGAWWIFRHFVREQPQTAAQPAINVPVTVRGPRLQINPQGDLEELRRQEDEILSTYGWVDREKGTARIRAMQLFLERQKKK